MNVAFAEGGSDPLAHSASDSCLRPYVVNTAFRMVLIAGYDVLRE
jgi:hypothetical protein